MKLTKRRVLGGLAATGVLAGTLAGGGVALASSGSGNAAAAVTTATPATGQCDGWFGGMGGPWGAGLHDGTGGIRAGQSVMKAAADYLGITQAQLAAKLQAGQSLADVAKAQNKSVTELKNALIAAFTSQVNASKLTAAQKAELISEAKSHIDAFVTMTHPAGTGPHWGGGPAHVDGMTPGGMHGMYREAVFGA